MVNFDRMSESSIHISDPESDLLEVTQHSLDFVLTCAKGGQGS